ncbi:D-amino-acid dehydrogenase [Filimonas lacunae]|uniref:D-amino-acid dehydrogenase n=1 Tax=Filimonas lacunae TaxID=477680 RepID=A0A173MLD0_9BACT|nr:FAD-dependent oxidoreductase [Filimonas lacunae]BAV08297.1 D-amino acid dehydrogenase small subunit [Filimonas lacunae]SIT33288.1 D-amino-acid dehydrogenase [Filimonas lacunae]
MKAIVIGGGIIGLSSAWFLREGGWDVTVIDKGDFTDNCSYGNAGYVCPSHFVPMAAPGIVMQGFKWMLNPQSPFYVKPRVNAALLQWGFQFMKSANARNVEKSALPLRDIALLSKALYESWATTPGFDFAYETKGMLEMFQTEANEHHAHHSVEQAKKLGLDAVLLSKEEVAQLEPHTQLNIRGAIHFKCDAHLYPGNLMKNLLSQLAQRQVTFIKNEAVTGFEKNGKDISKVITANGRYEADLVVVAAGSWSKGVADMLHTTMPMVGGRGYSVTFENSPYRLQHPAILTEGRVAISPMDGNKIRFGGTMEITALDAPPNFKRVQGILSSVKQFLPEYDIPMPEASKVWYGYRPCSADGLPYIGYLKKVPNCIMATGHSMLGVSLGPATGKLVSELAAQKATSLDMAPFTPERFAK